MKHTVKRGLNNEIILYCPGWTLLDICKLNKMLSKYYVIHFQKAKLKINAKTCTTNKRKGVVRVKVFVISVNFEATFFSQECCREL